MHCLYFQYIIFSNISIHMLHFHVPVICLNFLNVTVAIQANCDMAL